VLRADARYATGFFTDYANTALQNEDGDIGRIGPVFLVNAYAGYSFSIGRTTELAVRVGVRNLTNAVWISRTDDRNRGILPQAPRTAWLSFQLVHEFLGRRRDNAVPSRPPLSHS